MKDWIKNRAKEPTTYLGVALVIEGIGNLGKIDEAQSVASAVHAAAPSFQAGDWTTGLLALIMGIGGVLIKRNGGR